MKNSFFNGNMVSGSRAEILQDRHGLKLASYLTLSTSELPRDVTERLRAARMQAVAQRKLPKTQAAVQLASDSFSNGNSATLNWGSDDHLSWWNRVGAVLPLIALVVGLLFINAIQNEERAREVAEVDVALLTDELPPAAFSDPGFVQFLKVSN